MSEVFDTTSVRNEQFRSYSLQKPDRVVKRFGLKELHEECEDSWCVAQWPSLRLLLKEMGVDDNLPWVKLQLVLELDKAVFVELTYLEKESEQSQKDE